MGTIPVTPASRRAMVTGRNESPMRMQAWLVLAVLAAVVGCASPDVQRIGEAFPPRPADWPIEVYMSVGAPVGLIEAYPDAKHNPPPHKVIAMSSADADILVSWSHLRNMAVEQARAVGGDGIRIMGFVREYTGTNPTFRFQVLRWKP